MTGVVLWCMRMLITIKTKPPLPAACSPLPIIKTSAWHVYNDLVYFIPWAVTFREPRCYSIFVVCTQFHIRNHACAIHWWHACVKSITFLTFISPKIIFLSSYDSFYKDNVIVYSDLEGIWIVIKFNGFVFTPPIARVHKTHAKKLEYESLSVLIQQFDVGGESNKPIGDIETLSYVRECLPLKNNFPFM